MKAATRVFLKTLILIAVIGLTAGGAAAWQGARQSTPQYSMRQYLTMLTDNNTEKAYGFVDQSEELQLTKAEFTKALAAQKYSVYSSFQIEPKENRRDSQGNEFSDYHVKFLNAADEVQAEEVFTVKKQAKRVFGIFDSWKVLGDHCMVKDFQITVPAGSTVYLGAQEADASWMTQEADSPYVVYTVPVLLPGSVSLTVRHPVLESVNTTIDPTGDPIDCTTDMKFRKSAEDECLEIGVAVLKNLYTAAVKESVDGISDSMEACREDAEKFVRDQGEVLHREGADFKNIAVSAFAAQFGDLAFEEEDGSLQTEMSFSYHYTVKREVTTVSEEQYNEDGTPVEIVDTVADSGNQTAKMTLSYKDGSWKVTGLEIPLTK